MASRVVQKSPRRGSVTRPVTKAAVKAAISAGAKTMAPMARMDSSDKACLAKMSNPKLPAIAEFIKEGRESVQAVYGPNDKKLKLK